jgi:hypothetical protein
MGRDPVKDISGAFLVIYALAWVFILVVMIFSPSVFSTPEYEFNTNCDIEELTELQGKRILVLAFDYDELLILDADPTESFNTYDASGVESIRAYHKDVYLNKLGEYFDLIDISDNTALLRGRTPGADQAEVNGQLIHENEVDGALVIHSSYGYSKMIGFTEMALKQVLPKKIFDLFYIPGDDPSIERHVIASNMLVLNKNGEVVWNFFGVATINPEKVPGTEWDKMERVIRVWSTADPLQSEIVRIVEAGIDSYANYIVWLLESDLEGNPEKSYFEDYPDGGRTQHTVVYPALDQEHPAPVKVRTETELEARQQKDGWLRTTWDKAQASEWRIAGQWDHAGAAGVLCLLALTAFGIVIGLVMLALKITASSSQSYEFTSYLFGTLLMGVTFIGFVSLYLLLRAIF